MVQIFGQCGGGGSSGGVGPAEGGPSGGGPLNWGPAEGSSRGRVQQRKGPVELPRPSWPSLFLRLGAPPSGLYLGALPAFHVSTLRALPPIRGPGAVRPLQQ